MRFVPLLGGKAGGEAPAPGARGTFPRRRCNTRRCIGRSIEPFRSIGTADLGPLLKRIGKARVVLIGEATHGTSEFYRMRERSRAR